MNAANLTNYRIDVEEIVPILGLYQSKYDDEKLMANSGRIAIYGDSNCLDSAHKKGGNCCFFMLLLNKIKVKLCAHFLNFNDYM